MELKGMLDAIEQAVTEVAAKVGPLLAPVPTAYVVGHSVILNLSWPVWLGYVVAAVIELLGLATVNTALTLRDYNVSKRKSDPRAPVELSIALAGIYLVTAVTLAVLLDVFPFLAQWAGVAFPLLSLAGVTTLALRNDHRKRVAAIKAEKERRRKRRRERRQERKRKKAEMSEEAERKLAEAERKLAEARRKEVEARLATLGSERKTLRQYQETPDATQAEVAEMLEVSERTIRNHLQKLEEAGAVRRNGGGIEILV
jgi:DNA-binding transcriptional ArsR family regulator